MAIVYHIWRTMKKSRNGDTLGPVELILWPEQSNQGDRREQDDQGEVSVPPRVSQAAPDQALPAITLKP